MKKIILIISVIFMGSMGFAQNKNERASIIVDGVCGMCKERIEKASIRTKGVKSATWNVDTHELKLIYNAQRTDLDKIHQSIAESGHDTEKVKAADHIYNKIDACCKYRDPKVVEDHKDGGH